MTGKLNNIFIYLILLTIVAYGSACSSTNAQSAKTTSTAGSDKTESSKSEYKSPKRVSKDVISSDKKVTETKKK